MYLKFVLNLTCDSTVAKSTTVVKHEHQLQWNSVQEKWNCMWPSESHTTKYALSMWLPPDSHKIAVDVLKNSVSTTAACVLVRLVESINNLLEFRGMDLCCKHVRVRGHRSNLGFPLDVMALWRAKSTRVHLICKALCTCVLPGLITDVTCHL